VSCCQHLCGHLVVLRGIENLHHHLNDHIHHQYLFGNQNDYEKLQFVLVMSMGKIGLPWI
jgi:hypothetical protein